MKKSSKQKLVSLGLDQSDTKGDYVGLDEHGEVVLRGKVALRRSSVIEWAKQLPETVIAIEAGTHSPWLSRTLSECGHEVIVANPVKIALITKNKRKSDRIDAEYLARFARVDRRMLHPIQHRGPQAQCDLQLIRTRELVVNTRSKLINHVRGAVKSSGERLPKCSAEAFVSKASAEIPPALQATLAPVLAMIAELTKQIRGYDKRIEKLIDERYPEARHLQQIKGVGALTSLAYVLVLEDPHRYRKSRNVGAFLGLVPQRDQSGEHDPQLRISRAGDRVLRTLLIQSAHYILGPFGDDCDLRRHGSAIAARGGKRAKKRAAVAVARKLAVLLHRLWITQDTYDPLRNERRRVNRDALSLQSAA